MMILGELITGYEIGLIYGIVTIGIFLTFRVIDFPDLSCDGTFVLGAALSVVLMKSLGNPIIALLAALGVGALSGLMTGLLHYYFKITELLSGILVAFMLYSLNLKIMDGIPNITFIDEISVWPSGAAITFIITIIAGLIFALIGYLLMTDFGLALRSVGFNKVLALNKGINVNVMTIIGLMLSNSLIGLGGALFSFHQGFVDISQGIGTVITGLAGVIIGEKLCPFQAISLKILFCLIGSITYRFFIGLALHSEFLGIQSQDLNLVTGLMIITIMAYSRQNFKKLSQKMQRSWS